MAWVDFTIDFILGRAGTRITSAQVTGLDSGVALDTVLAGSTPVLAGSTPVLVRDSAGEWESDTCRGLRRDTVTGILFGTIIRGSIATCRVGKMAFAVDSRPEG